jgi:hypothetical protein
MLRWLFNRKDDQGDSGEDARGGLPLEELEREGQGEPRGGLQSEEYRAADPRELVEDGGVTMSAPGGAPQEGESPEERRERDRASD